MYACMHVCMYACMMSGSAAMCVYVLFIQRAMKSQRKITHNYSIRSDAMNCSSNVDDRTSCHQTPISNPVLARLAGASVRRTKLRARSTASRPATRDPVVAGTTIRRTGVGACSTAPPPPATRRPPPDTPPPPPLRCFLPCDHPCDRPDVGDA